MLRPVDTLTFRRAIRLVASLTRPVGLNTTYKTGVVHHFTTELVGRVYLIVLTHQFPKLDCFGKEPKMTLSKHIV